MDAEAAAGFLSLLALLRDLGALGGLGFLLWLILTGRVVTRGHLNDVMAAKNAELENVKAERNEWKTEAKRLADEIVPPLAAAVRSTVQEQTRRLREPRS